MRTLLLLLCLCLAATSTAQAYTYAEILQIYRTAGRKLFRDPELAGAMRLLRESRVLYLKAADPADLVAQVERPELLRAMATLHQAGLLPHASTSADTIHVEDDVLTTAPPAKKTRPIYQAGRVVTPIPFYEFIDFKNYYILGGLLDAGTEFEVVHASHEKVAMVAFEDRPPVTIALRHVKDLAQPRFQATQQPAGVVRKFKVGPATCYLAKHEYSPGKTASLSILWVPMDKGLTLRPFVTGAYNKRETGPTQVMPVLDMARQTGALAAINGTFFINAPRTPGHGKPLGPILRDGQLAWSYNEKRVLAMNRAYLAVTDDGRAVLGETDLPGEEIARLNDEARFLGGSFANRRARDLLGGLGWLIKDGNELAWQGYAGHQFWYTYYSYFTKRPQTVLGVTADGRAAVIVAQEGLPHSSRPMSLPMLARYLKANFGVKNAVFFDGGGSTEMVVGDKPVTRQERNGAYRKNSTALLVMRG